MEKLRKLIKEVLSTPPTKKDCNCGCHSCDNVGNPGVVLNESVAPKQILSENLRYHVENKLPLTENTFRYGSQAFLNLWAEARSLYLREIIHVNEEDKQILLETHLGNYGIYEGKKVPLDLPLVNEGFEWWQPLIALGGSIGLVAGTFFALVAPSAIVGGPFMGPQGWGDVVRYYKKKFKDKQAAKNLKKEDVLELINLIQTNINVSDHKFGVKRYMKSLLNHLEREMSKDEEELDKDKLLILLRDVQNYAKKNGIDISDAILKENVSPMEDVDWPQEVPSLYGDIIFKLVKVLPDRAKYELIDAETGKVYELGGRVFNTVDQLYKSAEDTVKPLGGRQSTYLGEAEKKKKNPPLNKPKRGGSKAYYVYVKDPKTKRIKKVSFGSGGLKAKINNPKARQAFAKRHRCSEKTDKTKASYWSCRLPRYASLLGLKSSFSGFW